jgi:hypothetical protein
MRKNNYSGLFHEEKFTQFKGDPFNETLNIVSYSRTPDGIASDLTKKK